MCKSINVAPQTSEILFASTNKNSQRDEKETATAIGTYTAFQSIASLIASATAGWIWYTYGSKYVFAISAVVAIAVAIYLYYFARNRLNVS